METVLEMIIKELSNEKNIAENFDEMFRDFEYNENCAHFGLGLYIRNKYLWNNPQNVKELEKMFGKSHPDDLSLEIIKYFYNYSKTKKLMS